MMKRLRRVTLALMAASLPLGTTFAQGASPAKVTRLAKTSVAAKTQTQKDFLANHPLLARRKALRPRRSAFPIAGRQVIHFTTGSPAPGKLFANASTTIWANLIHKSTWTKDVYGPFGYYSFSPTSPVNFTQLYETDVQSTAGYGVQYKDGHLYGLGLESDNYGDILYLYDTDTQTGQTTSKELDLNTGDNLKLIATETAEADDGTVYGEFYDETGDNLEWGIVDYSTLTRSTIGPATNLYVALGITKEGLLYGIADDGNLYKIDKNTGAETLVGPTGLGSIADSKGGYYGQTGEIDQRDNTFYWAAMKPDGVSGGLYEVNLETGAATLIDGEVNQLYGMYIPASEAEENAPAKAADLAADFKGTSLTGTVTFTAPSTTYGGSTLTGSLNYTVKANDSIVGTGVTTPGATVTASITLPANGNYNFEVTTSNAAGDSPKARLSNKWVGTDAPLPVTNVRVSKDGQTVTIAWTAPKAGIHDGSVEDALTFDVYRYTASDTTKIASGITDTIYVDNIGEASIKSYSYGIVAKADGQESAPATSQKIVVGSAIEPDWTENFDTYDDFLLFTIHDDNDDGKTWIYLPYQKSARSNYSSSNGNDDWLFTPPIHLMPGRLYNVSFKVSNGKDQWRNSLEVKWGTDTTAAAMTNTLVETYTPAETDSVISVDINPTAEGNYFIGFHDNTKEANMMYIYIDSISVTKGSTLSAPQAVTDLTVTPGERGQLTATLTFNVPTLSVSGGKIQRVDSLNIRRDGVEIASLPAAAAGSAQTYTDNTVPTNGTHTYEVIPYIGADWGIKASASAFIGQDLPDKPQNATITDNADNILATWDAFTEKGINGGYVNPDNISVSFFELVRGNYGYSIGNSIATSEPGATRVELPQNPEQTTAADGKTQALYQVAARTVSNDYNSDYVLTNAIVIGPSLQLPLKESFKGGNIDNGFAWVEGNQQWINNDKAAGWTIEPDNTVDNDGGSAFWKAYTDEGDWFSTDYSITPGDEVSLNTPKISLRGAINPKLYFSLYATAGDPAQLKVEVYTPDGVAHTAKTIDLSTTTSEGWTTQGIDLSNYASQRFITVKFHGIAEGSATVIGIDNVNVFDQLNYNLRAAGINTPSSIKAGKTGKVDVYVENFGANPATDYSVVLYSDNQPVDTVTVNDQLAVLAADTVTLTLPATINQTEDIKVKAEIVYGLDLDEDDNTTETKAVKVKPSEYTSVDDLSASQGNNGVSLNWSKPNVAQTETVTEGFESYDAFATQFGDWTTIDNDHGLAEGFFNDYSYPGQGTAFAFDIFNPNAITSAFDVIESNPGFAPHAGNQFAAAPYQIDKESIGVDADNLLISPELSGKAQTVTFYAFNLATYDNYWGETTTYAENFDVLYSTTDTDPASFTKIGSYTADGTNTVDESPNWKLITVQIPEGAKYFAIHHTTPSDNSFLFGIDDVTFEKSATGANDSIVAYNIYRDGKLIGSVTGDKATFTDGAADDGSHVYNITAVYQDKDGNRNESGFSNGATVTVTGIASITPDKDGKFNVYTVDGKAVLLGAKSLHGLKSGVYIINDRKYIVR